MGSEIDRVTLSEVKGTDRTQIRIPLYHNHLPKLEAFGYIRLDEGTDTIERGPKWEDVELVLRLFADHQDELPDNWV